MKNFEYSIGKDRIILSPEEHKEVLEGLREKRSHIILRNDTLIIRMDLIGKVQESDLATSFQEEEREKLLELPPEQRPRTPRIGTTKGFEKAVGEDWKICEGCKKSHYIPEGYIYCLPCARKNWK